MPDNQGPPLALRASNRRDAARWRTLLADYLSGRRAHLALPLALAALAIALPLFYQDPYWLRELSLIAVLALVVSGVNLSFGYAGELQLGQVFMYALGAYLAMILAIRGFNDIILLMFVGGAAAVAVGLLVAIPSMRIGGWALAMTSFFLVITIPDIASIFSKYTGGLDGLTGVPIPELFGHQLGNVGMYEAAAVATVIWFACYRNLVKSRFGVVFRVLRESPILTQSLGYSPFRLKTTVYALGAFPAGVAGCLFGYISLIVQPGTFGLTLGIGIVAASLFGGSESVYGVLIGAAILQLAPQESASFASYAPIIYGLFLIVAAVLLRGGIGRLGTVAISRLATWISPATTVRSEATGETAHSITRPSDPTPHARSVEGDRDVIDGDSAGLPTVKGEVLSVRNIGMSFGGVVALRGVSLTAEPGQVTALIGSNGSGKTTLLNIISGYISAQTGTIEVGGSDISRLKTHERALLGVGRTFQTPTIPRGVTVRDVVSSGRYSRDHIGFLPSILRLPKYRRCQKADAQEAMVLLALVGLVDLADTEAASLPLGARRLVEVARTLCSEPKVLLLDEPASGLNDVETARLTRLVRAVAESGMSVVVIEHNFRFITSIADTVHVLHRGSLIASGTPEKVAADRQVIDSYLGEAGGVKAPRVRDRASTSESGERAPILELDAIEAGYGDLRVLQGVSMSVRPGTIEVVLGRNGVGKTTLLNVISGLIPIAKGRLTLAGSAVSRFTPYRRAAIGITLVQEGKRIFHQRSVWENVMLGTYSLRVSMRERQALCRELLDAFPALRDRTGERAGGLSGGQQQMLAIAQALASRPKVLLLDEPSAGLAPSIVDEVFARLRELADSGLTIMLVEQLAEKAIAIGDHVTILDAGKIMSAGDPEDYLDQERLKHAYLGS
jgi:branched-chain amino acid transport system permease protein